MDAYRQQAASAPASEHPRHRVGSVSSSGSMGSMPPHDEVLRGPPLPPRQSPVLGSTGYPSVYPARPTDLHINTSGMVKDKKGSTRSKLMKRASRPGSPLMSPPPSVDSLSLPVRTDDANKILLLMKTLCGRMRGEVAYQNEINGQWHSGLCYIEEDKGSLMFDSGENGPFHVPVISDLRGCRVLPVDWPGMDRQCLEIIHSQAGAEVIMYPHVAEELDLWLAALLCWQQIRPNAVRPGHNHAASTPTQQTRPDMLRRGSSTTSTAANIIKVGKVALWDKGLAYSPQVMVKRPSTRDLRSSQTSWRKVSCILQDNGEFKLITENDVTVLSIISLSQLSRCAIQQLDKTVLDEEFCIAIFPIYSSTSTQLSIFRPVFISLDTRVLFEVWFVLLRAFTIPEIYGLDPAHDDQVLEILDLEADHQLERFRVEKTISLRIIEAKLGATTSPQAGSGRFGRTPNDQDYVGNYFAEVMLDGEVRARTTIKTDTKNPYWRDDFEFADLPSSLPFLSVILKRVDGNLESMAHQLQASLGLPRTGNLSEVSCGSVDIPLLHLDRGKEHEQWLQIYDERQTPFGSMLVKVRHEELVVFLAKDYQPLSEMLHKFSSGLTSQISAALPGQLRRVAEVFLNIFQVSGTANEWLMTLVEDEIDGIGTQASLKKMRFSRRLRSDESLETAIANNREAFVRDMSKSLAGEANLLFRGNSLLTQALEFHMRRLGKDYIEEVLGDKIFEINEINPNCEVDPGKLAPGEDINQHWSQLLQFTNEIWDCIANSVSKFPPELRHILKYIRAVAEDRYGDFLRTVAFTSVSGFLFLRFIVPAILNPKLSGLLPDYPRPRAQRTLTLVAKALQVLANLGTIGKKEVWMDPMNRFLNSHRQSLKDFIDEICSIPAERSNHILPASYSTPITILGRLSHTAREGFPSLPYLVDHARNFASLVQVWVDATPADATPAEGAESHNFEGELLRFHELCTDLQDRANVCMARIDAVRAIENASLPTDSESGLAETLEHASIAESIHVSRTSSSAAWMDNERPPGSSGSSVDNGEPREHRSLRPHWGSSSLRQASGSSEMSSFHPHSNGMNGTIKSLRSGKHARKFLSGLLSRRDRTGSPDASSSSHSPVATTGPSGTFKSRDKEKGRSTFGLPEQWQQHYDSMKQH